MRCQYLPLGLSMTQIISLILASSGFMFGAEGEEKYWTARKLLNAESLLIKGSNANRASLTEVGRQLHDAALKVSYSQVSGVIMGMRVRWSGPEPGTC